MTTDPYKILECPDELSQERKDELLVRPISVIHRNFTEEQLKIRKEIGKVITKMIYKDCLNNGHDDLAKYYLIHPPYFYYTDKNQSVKRRIYGFGSTQDNVVIAHAITALLMFNNIPIGGVPASELVLKDTWSDEQYNSLTSGYINDAGIFTDPLGFLLLAR